MLMFIYAVKIEGVRSSMACMIELFSKYQFSQSFVSKALASSTSEDCCHNTSASNVYIAAWQEIVKLAKVTELRGFYCPYNYSLCGNRKIRSASVYASRLKHVSRRSRVVQQLT